MDQYSKTSQLDIPEVVSEQENSVEKKRSRWSFVLAFFLCLIASLTIWIFVMETDTSPVEKEYAIGQVLVISQNGNTLDESKTYYVTLKGTVSALADISKENIVLKKVNGGEIVVELPQETSVTVVSCTDRK